MYKPFTATLFVKAEVRNSPVVTIHGGVLNKAQGNRTTGHNADGGGMEGEVFRVYCLVFKKGEPEKCF